MAGKTSRFVELWDKRGGGIIGIDTKQQVLFAIYAEYQKDIPNMESIKAKDLGIDNKLFNIAVDKLQNEGLIRGARFVKGGRNPHPSNVYLSEVKMTEYGLEYVENKLELKPYDSEEEKLKTLHKRAIDWGLEQLKDFAAKVLAEMLKK